MELTTRIFTSLPDEAKQIRKTVFMQEQGFSEEFDHIDAYARHILCYADGVAAATCRYFHSGREYVVGRLATLAPYRGNGIGAAVMRAAEDAIRSEGGTSVCIHAQVAARPFYEKCGYISTEKFDEEQGCPHVFMVKRLG